MMMLAQTNMLLESGGLFFASLEEKRRQYEMEGQ